MLTKSQYRGAEPAAEVGHHEYATVKKCFHAIRYDIGEFNVDSKSE